jgi:hypothetical protein
MQTYRFDLAPPNDGCDHLSGLRFGYGEYEAERIAYSKAMTDWWKDKSQPKPIHWRKKVGDPWALVNIYEDPDVILPGYQHDKLYEPLDLYVLLLESPTIVRTVHATVEAGGGLIHQRRLQSAVLECFRVTFKPIWLERVRQPCPSWYPESIDPTTGTVSEDWIQKRWRRTLTVFERSVDLVAQWLLLHYEMNPMEWAPQVALHVDEISPEWQAFIQRVNEIDKPPPIERIKKNRPVVVPDSKTLLSKISSGKKPLKVIPTIQERPNE